MDDSYYGDRFEITPLLLSNAKSVTDVECRRGKTLRWMKRKYPDAVLTGVDVDWNALEYAKESADRVFNFKGNGSENRLSNFWRIIKDRNQ